MKTFRHTLLTLLIGLLWTGCQEIEEPVNTVPTVTTDKVEKYSANFAYLSGAVTSRAQCYFLLSTSADMNDALQKEAYPYYNEERNIWLCQTEISDLQPGTTYYVVLCATDGRSEVKGNVVEFTTTAYLKIESINTEKGNFDADVVGVYVTEEAQTINPDWANLKARRNGDKSYELPVNILLSESPHTVYTYYPYNKEASGTSLNEIAVRTNGGSNDVLYGNYEVSLTNPKANITLKSALAQLYFIISTDNEEDIHISHINLQNTNKETEDEALSIQGTLDLTNGKITPRPTLGHDGIFMEIADNVIHAGVITQADMKVIPTSFEEGELELLVSVGGQIIRCPIPAANWEAGKGYEIPVKVNVESHKAKVGDYYYSDGTYSSTYSNSATSNKKCIGIVFALSAEKNGNIDIELEESYHGRIVALQDAHPESWSNESDDDINGISNFNLIDGINEIGYLPVDGEDTYTSTPMIDCNWNKWHKEQGKNYAITDYAGHNHSNAARNHTAIAACLNYNANGASWYLPSLGELARLGMVYAKKMIPTEHKEWNDFIKDNKKGYLTSTEGKITNYISIYGGSGKTSDVYAYSFKSGKIFLAAKGEWGYIRPVASF